MTEPTHHSASSSIQHHEDSLPRTALTIGGIPCILWGRSSHQTVLHVHGKMSRKEYAEAFARIAQDKGWQTLSFDLPRHGERIHSAAECTPFDAVPELRMLADWVRSHSQRMALYACSLGACFSLEALSGYPFEAALFQSPIVDMPWLIRQMQQWFAVTDQQLQAAGRIATPVDDLRWDWHEHALHQPPAVWPIPTHVLYGALDNLQSREVIQAFCQRTGAVLTISEGSEHPFMAPSDEPIVRQWIAEHLPQSSLNNS